MFPTITIDILQDNHLKIRHNVSETEESRTTLQRNVKLSRHLKVKWT